jgi:membrane AbrB-like protein
VSAVFSVLLELVQLPAALMLGPMFAGILMLNLGVRVRMAGLGVNFAQAVVGLLIARSITPEIVHGFARQWPLFLGITFATVLLAAGIGYLVARTRVVPGTTAIWGLLPGGAATMVLMAESYGADARLVAFMQYLRVLFVTVIASVVARLWVDEPSSPVAAATWFPPILPGPLATTIGLLAFGIMAGRYSRIPNGVLLLPMAAGGLLHGSGIADIYLPPWLLALSYLCLGWNIGLRFTREVLGSAGRALLPTVISILVVITACGGLAWVLVQLVGVDPLTAYLATSPGGADSVAIIAASSHVNTSFVMSLQTVRLLVLTLFGPALSRFIAGLLGPQPAFEVSRSSPVSDASARDKADRDGNVD